MKTQIADYSEDYFHDERREEVFRVLDAQLDTALFTPETTVSSIKIITNFAQNNLPFAIDLYQWVSSHALHASMNFLIEALEQQQDPAATGAIAEFFDSTLAKIAPFLRGRINDNFQTI